jgi:transcriptional regulator with XRE-family HTH domain
VGTGGISDARYLQQRHDRGYGIAGIHAAAEVPVAGRTPAQDLARIREIFKPAVSELATLFGVSRQAIYKWSNGERPKPRFAARLEKLAQAADVIAAENLADPRQALRRKISDGKTVLELVIAGRPARDTAQKLALILRREAAERKLLDDKLAARKLKPPAVDDLGSPMLDERA